MDDFRAARSTDPPGAATADRPRSSSDDTRLLFLAKVSHELRTQVHALHGYSELLGHVTGNGPGGELASAVHQRVVALHDLVDDLLDVATVAGGGFEIRPQPTDVRQLLATAVATASMAERVSDVDIRVAVADDIPTLLVLDGGRLQQVLANLLQNALRFTLDRSLDVVVSFADAPGGAVRFEVNDTGPGIPREHLDHIFDPFGRAGNPPLRGREGAGLGLTIVRDVVTAMGGTVGVESEPGCGSTFWFTVPGTDATATVEIAVAVEVARAAAPSAAVPPDAASPDAAPHIAATILVVDDSETNQQLVDRQLRTLGYEVVLAPSGRDALAVMAADVDLVLMDLNMPDLDGTETTRRLRALGWTTPIVALTASAMAADRAACLAVGMDDFLAKPIGMVDLGVAIDRVLGRSTTRATRCQSPTGSVANPAVAGLLRDIGPDATLGLFEVFLVESVLQQQAIATAIGSGDEDAFRRATHTLASTSALLGGGALESLCRAAERRSLCDTDATEFLGQLGTLLGSLGDEVRLLGAVIGRRAA